MSCYFIGILSAQFAITQTLYPRVYFCAQQRKLSLAYLHTVSLVVILLLVFLFPQTAWTNDVTQSKTTDEAQLYQRIGAIDRSIMLAFIRLARFNITFHQEANHHPQWRTLLYAGGRESGTAVSFASSLIDLRQRVRGFDSPSLISRNALRNAVNTSLVGSAISASASSLELVQNTCVMFRASRNGYSPKASVNFIRDIVVTTNALFEQRQHLVDDNSLSRRRELYELEALILHRIRQQLLFEFCTWSCHSRAQAWRENTFYGLDALQNFTRMSSAATGLYGFDHPRVGGGAAISSIVANSVATLNPIVCGLVGLAMHNYQRKMLSKEFQIDRPIVTPDESLKELHVKELQSEFAAATQTKLLEEILLLSDKSKRFDVVLDREANDIEHLRRVAQQQTIAGPLIGLTSVPAPILGTVAFYDYRKDRVTTNKLLFAGRVSAISGQAFALVQTPCTIIAGVIKHKKLNKLGESPAQLLGQRLKNLDVLEGQLRGTWDQ